MELTKAQERRLEQFRRLAEKELEHMQNGEIKNWQVKECGRDIDLCFSVGRVGDENIWLYFARHNVQVFIGPRGGVTYPVSKKLKNGEYRHYTKRWKGYSLYQIIYDQRI